MVKIIPAILATSEEEYKTKLLELAKNNSSKFDWIQIDLMDNKDLESSSFEQLYDSDSRTLPFPNGKRKFVGIETIKQYKGSLKIEVHLMVNNPSDWIDELISTNVKRVVGHIEVGDDEIKRFIGKAKEVGLELGLAINPETGVNTLRPYIDDLDIVLLMSVHPGRQGQQFMPDVLEKIKEIKQKKWPIVIEVDGGINKDVLLELESAGADNLVIGSHFQEILNG